MGISKWTEAPCYDLRNVGITPDIMEDTLEGERTKLWPYFAPSGFGPSPEHGQQGIGKCSAAASANSHHVKG